MKSTPLDRWESTTGLMRIHPWICKIHPWIFKIHPWIYKSRGGSKTKSTPLDFLESAPWICKSTPWIFVFPVNPGVDLQIQGVDLQIQGVDFGDPGVDLHGVDLQIQGVDRDILLKISVCKIVKKHVLGSRKSFGAAGDHLEHIRSDLRKKDFLTFFRLF